ncbi:MAG: hypothetical protein R3C53_12710 [Pirellulaceae bacterium]
MTISTREPSSAQFSNWSGWIYRGLGLGANLKAGGPLALFQWLMTGRKPGLLAVRTLACVAFGFFGLIVAGRDAQAGLAASDVVVVVNSDSSDSRTLANHYVAFRGIPASNVIVLTEVPKAEVVSVDVFRKQILIPLLTELERRRLADHVQCISYSADFPTSIDVSSDMKPLGKLPIYFTRQASINALTFLYSRTLASDAAHYINLNSNFYARRSIDSYFMSPAGNATNEAWNAIEKLIADEQHRQAADELDKLLEVHPHQFPLSYLAAAQAALAGETPRALRLLEAAIGGGWNAGGYLARDMRFDSVRDSADFQVLEFLMDNSIVEHQQPVGFNARTVWTPNGVQVNSPKLGLRYMLSTVLGVTRGGGTSLEEAIAALKRASEADGTHPQGGFYFCLTSDVRTTTRKPGFDHAIETLRAMGFTAEIVDTSLPMGKPSVLGAQLGTPTFEWSQSRSTLVPGAIAENLTSLGGVMQTRSGQTKLTELIKAGAAGSSGTVTEPYSLQPKFPHPQLYVHYAQGASLAEAFYLNVTGPYQLLIVGDPLCQPFSNAPDPQIDSSLRRLADGESLSLEPNLDGSNYSEWLDSNIPRSQQTEPLAATNVGVLFDSKLPQYAQVRSKLDIQIAGQAPGYHEVTLRFQADDPLTQRSDTVIPIWIGENDSVVLTATNLNGWTTVRLELWLIRARRRKSIWQLKLPQKYRERWSNGSAFGMIMNNWR